MNLICAKNMLKTSDFNVTEGATSIHWHATRFLEKDEIPRNKIYELYVCEIHTEILFSLEYNSYFLCQFDAPKFSEMFGSKLALINALL